MDYNADRRSERESSTAFSLESTFEKELNFTEILSKPPDDAYRMMLEYPNACWGLGTVDEIFGVKGRVSHVLYALQTSPLHLTCTDVMDSRVLYGRSMLHSQNWHAGQTAV